MTHEIRTTRLVVLPPGEPLFSEHATTVEIVDEAGGEFVVVEQNCPDHGWVGKVAITPEEWPVLRDAIHRMIADCIEDTE